ncbi:conserved hypothetical protein [Frankia canadensis]|uniref:CR-type domain-containing protein n=1 Tax=Frankia canadensis TaxID=1836972 RepID=A0A2I2KSZ7_9ACTN|nr:conserved hypothetical protein [Frankia canadensis]SOU56081.1 conserved hypothetical protein [Frankia canadensis]
MTLCTGHLSQAGGPWTEVAAPGILVPVSRARKRSSRFFRPPDERVSLGLMTCPSCNGTRYQTRPQAERDADGLFDGDANIKCRECGGTGKIPPR